MEVEELLTGDNEETKMHEDDNELTEDQNMFDREDYLELDNERDEETKEEPFSYDSSLYSKFSSSYKFNTNDILTMQKAAVNRNSID